MKRISVVLMAMVIVLCCLAGCGEQGASSGAENSSATSSSGAGSTAANGTDDADPAETTDAIGTTDASSTDAIGTDGTPGVTDADPAEGTTTTGTSGASKTSTTKKPATTTKKPSTTTKKPTTTTTTTTAWKSPIVWEEVERLVAQYINEYRVAQGDTPATVLPGLTEVARYRADELIVKFEHTDGITACNALKYGKLIDMTVHGLDASYNYYAGYNREAIGHGGVGVEATNETLAKSIADGFYNSKRHWAYVGSSQYSYIAVGIKQDNEREFKTWDWFCCICLSETNYG